MFKNRVGEHTISLLYKEFDKSEFDDWLADRNITAVGKGKFGLGVYK